MKSIFINGVSSVQLVLKYQWDLSYMNLDGRTNTNKGLKYMTNCYGGVRGGGGAIFFMLV